MMQPILYCQSLAALKSGVVPIFSILHLLAHLAIISQPLGAHRGQPQKKALYKSECVIYICICS